MMAIRMFSMRMATKIWYTEISVSNDVVYGSGKNYDVQHLTGWTPTCPQCHADEVEELKGELLIII